MKFIGYIILRFAVFIFRLIPFSLLYVISDTWRFVFQNVFRYRYDVIRKNLTYIFPELSKKELDSRIHLFYRNFIDISLESIKGLSYNPDKLISRYTLTNPEILDPYKETSIMLYSQHINNWEWGPICLGLQIKNHHIVGVIKRLSNPYIHNFIAKGRSGNNVSVITTGQTEDYINAHTAEKREAVVFIADQYPYNAKRRTDVKFFDQSIPFHQGAADIMYKTEYPVFAVNVKRANRGKYNLTLVKLAESTSGQSPQELTQKYARYLEECIKEEPHAWLWSHKRFKGLIDY